MNRLPDMMILDFCEWLKNKVASENEGQEFDVLDLILDETHNSRCKRYAEEYLGTDGRSIKILLHRFIDSIEFDECLNRCHPFSVGKWRERHHICPEEFRMFLHECFHCGRCEKYFDKFLRKTENSSQDFWPDGRISPRDLVHSVRHLIEQGDQPQTLQFMVALNADFSAEIDFLEWLIHTKRKAIKIEQMPLGVFEKLVSEYQQDCDKDDTVKQKLIQAFKQSDSDILAKKLQTFLPHGTVEKVKSLGYIIGRYSNRKIPYRCAILPLKSTSDEYVNFIETYWDDLHHMSADFLDIYYSETDYGKSGFEIMNQLCFIPKYFRGKVPCIVLWQDDMSKARSVETRELDNKDIFMVVRKIVESIQAKMRFEQIIQEAEKMSKDCRDMKRPINNVTAGGDIIGPVVMGNTGTTTVTVTTNAEAIQLISEFQRAIELIKGSMEINNQQRDSLIGSITEAQQAVHDGLPGDEEKSKSRFWKAMCSTGNAAEKLLSSLSSLTTLAKFFGMG